MQVCVGVRGMFDRGMDAVLWCIGWVVVLSRRGRGVIVAVAVGRVWYGSSLSGAVRLLRQGGRRRRGHGGCGVGR